MTYEHQFTTSAPVERVAAFHRMASSLAAITPPPILARVSAAPEELGEGDEMAFTLWLGPLPIRWRARIENVSEQGFVDRQVEGPFRAWRHHHRFEPLAHGGTRIADRIEYEYRRSPLWAAVGLGMTLGLPLLFAYRGWRTRALLEGADG
ncbi:MAG: SRPBCC family protein [Anaerolineae bacterium]|jgi:ligand-binding SRPBCC domain-containing protein